MIVLLLLFYALCAKIVSARFVERWLSLAEGARLELVFTGNCNEGSNPSLSANTSDRTKELLLSDKA